MNNQLYLKLKSLPNSQNSIPAPIYKIQNTNLNEIEN